MATKKKTPLKPQKLTGATRTLLNRRRKDIVMEQANIGRAMTDRAQALKAKRIERHLNEQPKTTTAIDESVRLLNVVGRSTSAVLASEGLRVAMKLKGDRNGTCFTDFKSITVQYLADITDPVNAAAEIRGIIYHEGGHLRFTIHPKELIGDLGGEYHRIWNMLEDQRMERAVVWDSPRKASYFVPMVLNRVISFYESGSDKTNAYLFVLQRRYLPREIRQELRNRFVAVYGNDVAVTLEKISHTYCTTNDRAVMRDSICKFVDVLKEISASISSIPSDGSHLHFNDKKASIPQSVPESNDDNPSDLEATVVPVPSTEQVDEPETAPSDSHSDDASDMGDAEDTDDDSVGGQSILDRWQDAEGDSDDQSGDSDQSGDGDKTSASDDSADDRASKPSTKDSADNDESVDEPEDISISTGTGSGSGGKSTETDEKSLEQLMKDAVNEAAQERNEDRALQQDIRTWNEHKGISGLQKWVATPLNDNALRQRGENLAADLVESFRAQFADRMPAWKEQQTRGVLNVSRYITRKPGDREFWRQWTDADTPGTNMAVSLLLDHSSSMEWAEIDLSVTAYACKRACDDLGIPCTVTVWNTEAHLLWEAMEHASEVPYIQAQNTTDPEKALRALHLNRCGKEEHLVIVMTDGAWDLTRDIRNYVDEKDRTVGIYFNPDPTRNGKDMMKKYGFIDIYGITDLSQIATYLRTTLEEMQQ